MKCINNFDRWSMMGLAVVLLLGSSVVEKSYAATVLGDVGLVLYEETYGFPTNIPIPFDTDFPANDENSATTGEVYFTYELSGSGSTYYSSHTLTIESSGPPSGELQITLNRNNDIIPDVGIYEVTVAIDMIYKNSAGDILMHVKTYTVTIQLTGSESGLVLNSDGIGIAEFNEEINTGQTNADSIISTEPNDLELNQAGGTVEYGSDITLVAGTFNTDYKVWLDASIPVEVYSDPGLSNKVYEWPISLIDNANFDENDVGTTNQLTVTLRSVPTDIYNLGTVYVTMTLKYRDTSGDIVSRQRVLITQHEDDDIDESSSSRSLREGDSISDATSILGMIDEDDSNHHQQQQQREEDSSLSDAMSILGIIDDVDSNQQQQQQQQQPGLKALVSSVVFDSATIGSLGDNNDSSTLSNLGLSLLAASVWFVFGFSILVLCLCCTSSRRRTVMYLPLSFKLSDIVEAWSEDGPLELKHCPQQDMPLESYDNHHQHQHNRDDSSSSSSSSFQKRNNGNYRNPDWIQSLTSLV